MLLKYPPAYARGVIKNNPVTPAYAEEIVRENASLMEDVVPVAPAPTLQDKIFRVRSTLDQLRRLSAGCKNSLKLVDELDRSTAKLIKGVVHNDATSSSSQNKTTGSDIAVIEAARKVMNQYEIRQTQLAREIGLTQGRVSQILTGKVRITTKIKKDLIAWTRRALGGKRPSASELDKAAAPLTKRRRLLEWKKYTKALAHLEHIYVKKLGYFQADDIKSIVVEVNELIRQEVNESRRGKLKHVIIHERSIYTWFSNRRKRDPTHICRTKQVNNITSRIMSTMKQK